MKIISNRTWREYKRLKAFANDVAYYGVRADCNPTLSFAIRKDCSSSDVTRVIMWFYKYIQRIDQSMKGRATHLFTDDGQQSEFNNAN